MFLVNSLTVRWSSLGAFLVRLEPTVLTLDSLADQAPHEIEAEIAPVGTFEAGALESMLLLRVDNVEAVEYGVRFGSGRSRSCSSCRHHKLAIVVLVQLHCATYLTNLLSLMKMGLMLLMLMLMWCSLLLKGRMNWRELRLLLLLL